MQPLTATPREHLTADQVTYLLQDAPSVTWSSGCEVLDRNLDVLGDISEHLAGGSVTRESFATLHGHVALHLSTYLDWGAAVVRPYMTVSDGLAVARFNLGAYFTSLPDERVRDNPPTYEVTGFDILEGLSSPAGEMVALPEGAPYLALVQQILTAQGYTRVLVDQSGAGKVAPTTRVWMIDEQVTWIGIVNDLLGAIGYQGVWSDWDGVLRVQPYHPPSARPPEWTYLSGARTMIEPERIRSRDFYATPNRWVAVRDNAADGPAPVEGDGIYTVTNDTVGDTSVLARGRVITRVLRFDVADQASLVAATQAAVSADMSVTEKWRVRTAANPLHWHFDRVLVDDPEMGGPLQALATAWTLDLNGRSHEQEWTVLS